MANGALTYAGVELPLSDPEMDEWVNIYVSWHEIFEFARRSWPGSRLTGMTYPNMLPFRPITLGVLHWPVGASRWATFHTLASTTDLATLRPLCYGITGAQLTAQDLVLDDGTESVAASMYMLPPRRLSKADIEDAYLLTLVDQRYYWWQRNAGVIQIDPGITTWQNLYAQMEVALGISIGFDSIDSRFATPYGLAAFDTSYEPLPVLFDAVAYNCGQRVVCGRDGTVRCPNLATSVGVRDANTAQGAEIVAGGPFNFDTVIP